jgi:NAD(P)-dependent dehydrogenase (short-subunit alcohol dehydrogenase family)
MLWNNPNVKSGQETINPDDVGKPEDIAAAIAYLASDDAQFAHGTSLRVDCPPSRNGCRFSSLIG